LNQSVALKKAGFNEVFHAGNIGKNGDFLKYTLLEYGVDISYLIKSNVDTGHAIIQVAEDGQHNILVFSGSNYSNKDMDIDKVIAHFDPQDCLLVQNEINNVPYIVEQGYERGMRIFFNPSPFNEQVLNVDLSKVETLIVNEHELLKLSGFNTLEEAWHFFKPFQINVLLTKGLAGGEYYGKDGAQYTYKAFCVEEVDSTAVGDVFVGYFVAEMMLGKNVEDALDHSSKAAALSTMKEGTVLSIPSTEEVDEYFGDAYED
jgi:ribokinase